MRQGRSYLKHYVWGKVHDKIDLVLELTDPDRGVGGIPPLPLQALQESGNERTIGCVACLEEITQKSPAFWRGLYFKADLTFT